MRQSQWIRAGVLLAALLLLFAMPSWTQRRQFPSTAPPSTEPSPPPLQQTLRRRMVKASYEQLQKDVEQLVKLTSDLKDEVEKADEDTLSLGVVRKAEEIEKLSEKIKNRMKNL
ncbi:MAG: hypothetical protein HY648_11085 [Acidobacteria bacterium]|nr:hypothetical protein [Acidobacteriota bacterium]